MSVGKEITVRSLLPVIDNIERALGHLPKDLEKNEWAKGVSNIAKQLEDALAKLGVKKIAAKGKEFDPHLMEAVAVEGEGERETVTAEMQTGYTMNGEVIRHAMVKVEKETVK